MAVASPIKLDLQKEVGHKQQLAEPGAVLRLAGKRGGQGWVVD